ncbi:DUF6515 family protein [Lutibacter sp.]
MKATFSFIFLLFYAFVLTSCVTTVRPRPTNVVVVKKIPRAHKIVYINGHQYYKWNGKHYRKTTKGYVFVRF